MSWSNVFFVCLFVWLVGFVLVWWGFFCFVFETKVSLCSLQCPGTYSVDQAGLGTNRSACLYLLSAGTKGMRPAMSPIS